MDWPCIQTSAPQLARSLMNMIGPVRERLRRRASNPTTMYMEMSLPPGAPLGRLPQLLGLRVLRLLLRQAPGRSQSPPRAALQCAGALLISTLCYARTRCLSKAASRSGGVSGPVLCKSPGCSQAPPRAALRRTGALGWSARLAMRGLNAWAELPPAAAWSSGPPACPPQIA